jgi:hypothetical protein
MSSIADALSYAVTAIPGLAVAGGLLCFVYKRNAGLWDKLAEVYAREWREGPDERRFQSAVAYTGGKTFVSYKGFLVISLHGDGFAIKPMNLFSLFHKPLFIPYADVEGWRTQWYLDSKSIELTFAKAPAVKLVMPEEQVQWIAGRGAITVRDAQTPHEAKPHFWYWLVIVNGVLGLGVLAYVVARAWPGLTD